MLILAYLGLIGVVVLLAVTCILFLFAAHKKVFVLLICMSVIAMLSIGVIFSPVGGYSRVLISIETSPETSERLEEFIRIIQQQMSDENCSVGMFKVNLEQVPLRYALTVRFECNKVSFWNKSSIVNRAKETERRLKVEFAKATSL